MKLFFLLNFFTTLIFSQDLDKYPKIYPFVPKEASFIQERTKIMTENPNAILNIIDSLERGHAYEGAANTQPWTSTYWPLLKGLVADPYANTTVNILGRQTSLRLSREVYWRRNHKQFLKRLSKVHRRIDQLSQEELDVLAPSEKYDLLLGDKTFHLTRMLWNYAEKWGKGKANSFIVGEPNVLGGGAFEMAKEWVAKGWEESLNDALPKTIALKGGLIEHMAKRLIKEGTYSSFENALPFAKTMALNEKHNYVLKKPNDQMKTWEGICHGWSTAAGIIPRPRRTVSFNLPDGRVLNFYPDDIKGLISLLWANSLVQDARIIDEKGNASGGGILMQGLRCNEYNVKRDEWGRYYDTKPDDFSMKVEPRCVGVHPALWHLALINLLGEQGRSFIVERQVSVTVDNHPLQGYKMKYFNPNTGEDLALNEAIIPINEDDQFYKLRSPEAKYIVGVETTMRYMNWTPPKRKEFDSEEDDLFSDKTMFYDLELDEAMNVVGGQWRAVKKGKPNLFKNKERTQPDFFWVVTKDWKNYFKENTQVSKWTNLNTVPPKDWLAASRGAHSFRYFMTKEYGFFEKCRFVHKKKRKDEVDVPCERVFERPQPFLNVINKLIDLSK